MKKFYVDNGPHIKTSYNTSKMMVHLFIALLPIIIFSSYKNGFLPYYNGYGTLFDAFRPILLILTGAVASFISEALFCYFVLKKKSKEKLFEYLKYSYAIYPGLFLALIIPVNTSFSILIVGSMFATIVGKMLFGGFGYNIFNPALIGNLFLYSTYYANIAASGGYLNKMEIDTITKATPLTNLQSLNYIDTYSNIVSSFGNLWDFLFGFIPGTMGETSAILCLVGFVYLVITKVIKWRIPVIYISTVFIITGIIGYFNGLGLWYPLFHILSGGLMFGAVFMATDPVTSPATPFGQVIYAICLGFLTVVFRLLTTYPEGVLTAILTLNMFIFIIDKIGSKVRFNSRKMIMPLITLLVLISLVTIYITYNIGKTDEISDRSFNVIDIVVKDNNTIYLVTHKAYHGLIKANVIINNETNKVIKIDIVEQKEDVWQQIENDNYLTKIIKNQDDLNDLDTITGATLTSNYLKQLVSKVLDDYNKKR